MEKLTRRFIDRLGTKGSSNWSDRYSHFWEPGAVRCPRWGDQVVQFLTRYLFFGLGLAFFNLSDTGVLHPLLIPLGAINLIFGLYFILVSVLFLHAYRHSYSPTRFRFAMWIDITIVTFALVIDPHVIPPTMLVYTMVVLGNGMRYGMRLFGEALIGSLGGIMLGLTLRVLSGVDAMTLGVVFLNLFGAIILIYAYVLMSRVEQSRRVEECRGRQDPLTGLLNRRALENFSEFLFPRLGKGELPFVIMLADLDRFKLINDTQGHAVGDVVLRRIAGILKCSIRSSDIVARYGGDEFVVLLEQSDLDQAEIVAQRVHLAIDTYAKEANLDLGITLGLGRAPDHGEDLETVLRHVDRALYDSKSDESSGGIKRVDLMSTTFPGG